MEWSWRGDTGNGLMESRPLTPQRFADIETVFGGRGVARSCFCMYWRRPDSGFGDDRDNRDRFADVTRQGPPPGLIGYLDGAPVGWVQVGPRGHFPTMQRSPLVKPVDDTPVWSINCFVTRVGCRRQGIGSAMLASAIDYARSQGATVVEAYPYDERPSSAANYFTGTMEMFAGHDFIEIARRKPARPILRMNL